MKLCGIIWLLGVLVLVSADHFMGGTLNWRPVRNKPNTAHFTFRTNYFLKHPSSPGCTKQSLGKLQKSVDARGWDCVKGCGPSPVSIAPLDYYCTTVDTTGGFEQGENDFEFEFTNKSWPSVVGHRNAFWRQLNWANGKAWTTGKTWLKYELNTVVDLRVRSDTNFPNSSPLSVNRPIYRLQMGCLHRVQLLAIDPDGDFVRCRWAKTEQECGDTCRSIPGAFISNHCVLTVDTSKTNGFQNNGWYAVALMIEDFPRQPIRLFGSSEQRDQNTALSAIPFQLLINTYKSADKCDDQPQLVTVPSKNGFKEGSRVPIPKGGNFEKKVTVSTAQEKIMGLTVLGPRGVTVTELKPEVTANGTNITSALVRWKPGTAQGGEHLICVSADNDKGKTSATRCLTVAVGDKEDCKPNPCGNGAVCIDLYNNYKCDCPKGFTGRNCTEVNGCKNSTCLYGNCVDFLGSAKCLCDPGYEGNLCDKKIDFCVNNTCAAGSTCISELTDFRCECPVHKTGRFCETIKHPCSPNPCQHNASCFSSLDKMTLYCACPKGYEGLHCEKKVDPCAENPCVAGGKCEVVNSGFICRCPTGRTGPRCGDVVNLCQPNTCQNNGTCLMGHNGLQFQCKCLKGFTGNNCEQAINVCSSAPCANGGLCREDGLGDFTCDCKSGYTGRTCVSTSNLCSSNPCLNGGFCETFSKYKCTCKSGYIGDNCESAVASTTSQPSTKYPQTTVELLTKPSMAKPTAHPKSTDKRFGLCSPNPCRHGGKCVMDSSTTAHCECMGEYSGTFCEILQIKACSNCACGGRDVNINVNLNELS